MKHCQDCTDPNLRYLDAARVESPAGSLASVDVLGPGDHKLGKIEGVLLDPTLRRVRYFIVASTGWTRVRRFLLSVDSAACVDPEVNRVHVDVELEELKECGEFDACSVEPCSDEDLITAMFASHAA